ncbi:MAG TPA: hypothetical protein VFB23_11420 [Candidatus Acidoferrales bacterium]|nr:hypothetical protein [Candidatus Acidoferrales bacterium]
MLKTETGSSSARAAGTRLPYPWDFFIVADLVMERIARARRFWSAAGREERHEKNQRIAISLR